MIKTKQQVFENHFDLEGLRDKFKLKFTYYRWVIWYTELINNKL